VENRYQRSQIQNAAHRYEQQIYEGVRPIIGLNRYRNGADEAPEIELARTPKSKQQLQIDRLKKFKARNAAKANKALDKLAAVAERDENIFPALLEAAEVCSLGQISERLQQVVADLGAAVIGHHEGLVDQPGHDVGDVARIDVAARAHRLGRIERAPSGEDRQPVEHLLLVGEQESKEKVFQKEQCKRSGDRHLWLLCWSLRGLP